MPASLATLLRPRWLQGMVWPTLLLWLYACAYALAVLRQPDGVLPPAAHRLSATALALVITGWVMADARKRHRPLCYDYDTLVFFLWPVVVPVYLIRTRGWRALLTGLCFLGIWVVMMLGFGVTMYVREFFFRD